MDSTWIFVVVALVVAYGLYSLIKKSIVLGLVLVVVGFLLWPTLKSFVE